MRVRQNNSAAGAGRPRYPPKSTMLVIIAAAAAAAAAYAAALGIHPPRREYHAGEPSEETGPTYSPVAAPPEQRKITFYRFRFPRLLPSPLLAGSGAALSPGHGPRAAAALAPRSFPCAPAPRVPPEGSCITCQACHVRRPGGRVSRVQEMGGGGHLWPTSWRSRNSGCH